MASTSEESYGIASYAISRHRKNKVFMWQIRVQHVRVYEFLLASRFKVPGLVSWKCMHCMQIREKKKRQVMASTSKESYGIASYAISRHRKNKVFMWQSRVQHGRVYEFLLASRFKVPGLVSWKCMHCMQIREKMKRQILYLKQVCTNGEGYQLVGLVHLLWRPLAKKLRFFTVIFRIMAFVVPLDLDAVQKRQMKQSLDEKCERVMKKVLRKRKREVHKDYPNQPARVTKRMELSNDYCDDDGNRSTEVVVSS
uniref:Zf-3CxxC domain-containing protein n=1 Tax=Angiostrongylus cantonensis TaxID=6313 RepID=A0A0K0D9D9_ANGCA